MGLGAIHALYVLARGPAPRRGATGVGGSESHRRRGDVRSPHATSLDPGPDALPRIPLQHQRPAFDDSAAASSGAAGTSPFRAASPASAALNGPDGAAGGGAFSRLAMLRG